jgi:hypothetical protein
MRLQSLGIFVFVSLGLGGALAACGSADADGGMGGAGGEGGGTWEGTGPAYAVSTRVFNPETDGATSFFHLVDSLDADTKIDPSTGLEFGGSARLFASEEYDWFAIGSGEDSTITRITLGPDGIEPGESISLASYGVTSHFSDEIYFVSKTKAYYPDREGEQLIVINPEKMTVEGSIELPDTHREGFLALYGYEFLRRGDLLLFSVGWFDWNQDIVLDETGLVAIDTETDTVVSTDVDTRCGGITTPVNLASGDTYFLTSALASANYRIGRMETEPCALRVLADEDTFDADYAEPLASLVDGQLAGEPVSAGGNELYFRVFDEEEATIEDGQYSWDLTGQLVWSWVRWDVSEDEAVLEPSLEPSTADVVSFFADGQTYGMEALDADYSRTRLIQLSVPGAPEQRLTATGFLQGLARMR